MNDTDLPSTYGKPVFTGSEDPNNIISGEVTVAEGGSLFIDTANKVLYQRNIIEGSPDWGMIAEWKSYIAGSGIDVNNDIISIKTEGETLGFGTNGLKANSSSSLWNANKLQGIVIDSAKPQKGQVLSYDGGSWTNKTISTSYIAGNGIDLHNNKISVKIDGKGLSSGANGLKANSDLSIWNAAKLKGAEIDVSGVSSGQILSYDGTKWINVSPNNPTYIDGLGIDINGNTINVKADGVSLIADTIGLKANMGSPLWNANKLRGIPLDTASPETDQVLSYDGSKWISKTISTGVSYIAGEGIDLHKNKISVKIDGKGLSFEAGSLKANKDLAIWNAAKLQNAEIEVSGVSQGQILGYNGTKWVNIDPNNPAYIDGLGIDINGSTINVKADELSLTADTSGLKANMGSPLWNANKLQGIPLDTSSPEKDQVLSYDGSKWISRTISRDSGSYVIAEGLELDGDKLFVRISGDGLDFNEAGHLIANYNDPLWNASSLQGNELNLTDGVAKNHVLVYDGELWTNGELAWLNTGNSFTEQSTQILGFTDPTSKTSIAVKTKNQDRITISDSGDVSLPTIQEAGDYSTTKYRDLVVNTETKTIEMKPAQGGSSGGGIVEISPGRYREYFGPISVEAAYNTSWVDYPGLGVEINNEFPGGLIYYYVHHTSTNMNHINILEVAYSQPYKNQVGNYEPNRPYFHSVWDIYRSERRTINDAGDDKTGAFLLSWGAEAIQAMLKWQKSADGKWSMYPILAHNPDAAQATKKVTISGYIDYFPKVN